MIIERKKNATRNVFFGVILKIYTLALPFVMRTVLLYLMGVEYLGLNSLFVSILQVLNLAELGVGSAMVFAMYKPIVEDDKIKICALMKLYRFYYRIIGSVVLGAGLLITPFVPKLIKGSVPDSINVYILYLLNLLATVFTYWLFAYRNSILTAYQRSDVISKVSLLTSTIQFVLQFIVLYLTHNYYYYVVVVLLTQILNNILIALICKKMYPDYQPVGKLPQNEVSDINHRVKDVFTSKLGGTILNSADTIVISAFLGLAPLAIYQNYFYVLNAAMGIMLVLFSSITAGVGNSLLTESLEKNYIDFRRTTLITFLVMGVFISELFSLYQPFMEFWAGKELMLPNSMVILFCVYFFDVIYVQLASVYKDAAGIWHQDRYRPLISALTNLVLNLIMVNYWGLYGILLSTIISAAFISFPWITHNLFHLIFKGYFKDYFPRLLYYSLVVLITVIITGFAGQLIVVNGFLMLILRAFLVLIVSFLTMALMLFNNKDFRWILDLIKGIIIKKKS